MHELTILGALTGCARTLEDRGAAPIADNADAYLTWTVTVLGKVDDVRGTQTFTLSKNDLVLTDEHLLVITERPARELTMGSAVVYRGEWLRIHGTIERLSVAEMEREYEFDLDADLEVIYANRPVLVANWITASQ